MRFSIRDLLWATLVIAMGLAWWLDRSRVPDADTEERVRGWLAKSPFAQDLYSEGPEVDYVEWIAEGRSIPNIEPVLRTMLSNREVSESLPAAARSLGELGDAKSVSALIDCLGSENEDLRSHAVAALGELRDERAIEPLAKLLAVEPGETERVTIVCALANIGGSKAMKHVETAVNDKSGYVSITAKEELATKGTGYDKYQTTDERVRQWLARTSYVALRTFNRHAIPPRPAMDFDEWIAQGAKITNVETTLCTLLRNRDSTIELALIAMALGRLGSSESVPVLIECLGVQEVFYDEHGMFPSAPARRDKAAAARSYADSLRYEAAYALGELRDKGAVEALGNRLQVEHGSYLRSGIVWALRNIGGPEAIRYLEMAARDKDSQSAKAATEALKELAADAVKTAND